MGVKINPAKKKKVKPKKKRKTWLIRPTTRVHGEKGYKRPKVKKKLREEIESEQGKKGTSGQ